MREQNTAVSPAPRPTLDGPQGLVVELTSNGSPARFEAFGRSLLLYPSTELECGPANVHLRVRRDGRVLRRPLLGPASGGTVVTGAEAVGLHGSFEGLEWSLVLVAGRTVDTDRPEHASWRWQVEVENTGATPVEVDVVLTHDPALADPGAVRTNEYYVAQYLDLTPVETSRGTAVAVRQNMPGKTVPWLAVGALRRGTGWATDALQVTERTATGTEWTGLDAADLPSVRHQHEHSLVVLADEPVTVPPGGRHRTGFVGVVVADHPAATGPQDAAWLDVAVSETSTVAAPHDGAAPVSPTLFGSPALDSRPLTDGELDVLGIAPAGTVETSPDGRPWAWTVGSEQVVLAAKDLAVLRPHGQILRTGTELVPDERSLTTTVWMDGTFLSQVTSGHVGRDALLTGRRSYLGLLRAHGLRLFVRGDDGWTLLGTPSAWRVGLDAATWWYAGGDLVLEVSTRAPEGEHRLAVDVTVHAGTPRELLVAVATTGGPVRADGPDAVALGTDGTWRLAWTGARVSVSDDDVLHADGHGRDGAWVTLAVPAAPTFGLRLDRPGDPGRAPDDGSAPESFWQGVARTLHVGTAGDATATADLVRPLDEAVPWFAHDAVVHYLSPRGLEQYSGGAWGTRDVCQGPVGLLTALDRQDVVRSVLTRVFRGQNARGDWPQAFEFLPPLPAAGQQDSHGDVVFWPVLATGDHLLASGSADLLAVEVPFVGDDGLTDPAPVVDHLARALDRIEQCSVEGSPLPAYGHGDWNDSLQPADPRLAKQLVSVWTAVLQTQALRTLARGLRAVGAAPELAERAADLADATEDAIHGELVVDGVLLGYLLHTDDGTEPLVHPRDTRTGLTLGVLPWIHAVSADLLTPDQAQQHLALVEEHLLGPDGARLFDRPVAYAGGPMSVFQRAEASTFWGREIGLMYVHAHLRYAEALARTGDGPGLLRALALATPGGAQALVPGARPRQTSCYASSSDAVFTDRYDAQERYDRLMAGEVPVEAGWRVYSSGPGLFLRLLVETFVGVRRRGDLVEIDPVLDPALGELRARVPFDGDHVDVLVRTGPTGHGVRSVTTRDGAIAAVTLENPYRVGGVAVRREDLRRAVASRPADGSEERPDLVVETL